MTTHHRQLIALKKYKPMYSRDPHTQNLAGALQYSSLMIMQKYGKNSTVGNRLLDLADRMSSQAVVLPEHRQEAFELLNEPEVARLVFDENLFLTVN